MAIPKVYIGILSFVWNLFVSWHLKWYHVSCCDSWRGFFLGGPVWGNSGIKGWRWSCQSGGMKHAIHRSSFFFGFQQLSFYLFQNTIKNKMHILYYIFIYTHIRYKWRYISRLCYVYPKPSNEGFFQDFSAKWDEIDLFFSRRHFLVSLWSVTRFFFLGGWILPVAYMILMEFLLRSSWRNRFSTLACVLKRWEEWLKGVGHGSCIGSTSGRSTDFFCLCSAVVCLCAFVKHILLLELQVVGCWKWQIGNANATLCLLQPEGVGG